MFPWLKSKTADKVLSPIRGQLIDSIEPGASVLEIGSGTGALLLQAAPKIRFGVGVDSNNSMVQFARMQADKQRCKNIQFKHCDAQTLKQELPGQFDVATATLCLHEMAAEVAMDVFLQMSSVSSRVLIADYQTPHSMTEAVLLELDELVSGHYLNFRRYRASGGFPALIKRCNLRIESMAETEFESIAIWQVGKP